MTKITRIVCGFAGIGCAASFAMAAPVVLDVSFEPLDLQPVTERVGLQLVDADFSPSRFGPAEIIYQSIAASGGYLASPAATGVLGADDYTTSVVGEASTFELTSLRFVGGVQQTGGTISFQFFDSSQAFVDSFNVTFTNTGNFIYNITVGDFIAPTDGFLQLAIQDPLTTGQWFLTGDAPAVGSSAPIDGGANGDLYRTFELTGSEVVPEPATLGLAAFAALGLMRRRTA